MIRKKRLETIKTRFPVFELPMKLITDDSFNHIFLYIIFILPIETNY